MTVSPTQPQDRRSTHHRRNDSASPASKGGSDPLPPTLFALPDLNPSSVPAPAFKPQTNEPQHDQSQQDQPQEQPQQDQPLRNAPAGNQETDVFEAEIASPDPFIKKSELQATYPDIPASEFSISDPADFRDTDHHTSLLDRVGSHAIVLLMLLIVFGIALVAGKDSSPDSSTPIATNEGVIEETNSSTPSQVATHPTVGPVQSVGVSEQTPVATNVPPIAVTKSTQDLGTAASAVSTRTANSPTEPSGENPSIGGQVSQLLQNMTTTDAGTPTASPSSVADTVRSQPTVSGAEQEPTVGQSGIVPYRQTSTPQKIVDWSRYIPADATYVTPASATSPQ